MEAIHAVEAKVIRTPASAVVVETIHCDVLAVNCNKSRPVVIGIEMNLAVGEGNSPHVPQPPSVGWFRALACRLPIIGLGWIDGCVGRRMPSGNRQIHIGDADVLDGNTHAAAHCTGELPTTTAGVNRGHVTDADVADNTDRGPRSAATGAIASLQPNRNRGA